MRRWVINATPSPLYVREWAGTRCIRCSLGPRTGLDECEKSRPPQGFDPQTVQPVASRHTGNDIPAHADLTTNLETWSCNIFSFFSNWEVFTYSVFSATDVPYTVKGVSLCLRKYFRNHWQTFPACIKSFFLYRKCTLQKRHMNKCVPSNYQGN